MAKIYRATHDLLEDGSNVYDAPLPVRLWHHLGKRIVIDTVDHNTLYATDGSKYQGKVGAAAVIPPRNTDP